MASLIVRKLDDSVVRLFKERAQRNGRSVEAEHRLLLEEAVKSDRREELTAQLAAFRASMEGRHHTPAAELIREGREER